jgi:PAS domain S-box-containing protein
MKDNLSRLVPAITREIGEAEVRREHRQAELALVESERKYRSIFESFYDIYFQTDMRGRIILLSPSVRNRAGYDPDDLIGSEAAQICQDPETYIEIHRDIVRAGSVIDKELAVKRGDGSVMYASLDAHLIPDLHGNPTAIEGILHDISACKRVQFQLEDGMRSLTKAIDGTVEALSRMSEARDPYTAGHQRRVSTLVSAIGREMALSDEQINGLGVAGAIHDLGKIQVPAEILNKPGFMTEIELSIIRMHPRVGYEILKNIDFPWPIADIVVQHHERIDGSGYPDGIRNDEILLEAKVLAVADVVEAMASHRPYRPALGIDQALDEIERNSGHLYDADVANACLKVFSDGAFEF